MHRTIASKEGGYNVECTPEEAAAFEEEWKKNAAEEKAKEEAAKIEKEEAEKAFDNMTKDCTPAEKEAMRKWMGL